MKLWIWLNVNLMKSTLWIENEYYSERKLGVHLLLLEVWKSGFSRMDLFKRFHPCKYLNWPNLRKLRMKLVFSKKILEYKVQIFKVKKIPLFHCRSQVLARIQRKRRSRNWRPRKSRRKKPLPRKRRARSRSKHSRHPVIRLPPPHLVCSHHSLQTFSVAFLVVDSSEGGSILWCPIKMRVFHQNESRLSCLHPPSSYEGRREHGRLLSFWCILCLQKRHFKWQNKAMRCGLAEKLRKFLILFRFFYIKQMN